MERLAAISVLVAIGAAGIAWLAAPAAALPVFGGLTGAFVAHAVGVPEDPEDWARMLATGFHFGVLAGALLGVVVIVLTLYLVKSERVWRARWLAAILSLLAVVVLSVWVRIGIDLLVIAGLMWFSPSGARWPGERAWPAKERREDEAGQAQV